MKSFLLLLLNFISLASNANTFDVKHIALTLSFDWAQSRAEGIAKITCSPTKSLNRIDLDAAMLNIKSVSLEGKKLHFIYSADDPNQNLEIKLGRTFLPSETITLTIDYQTNHQNKADPNAIWGSFGKGLRFQFPTSTTPNKRKQIWSSGEPDHNRYWFPCNENIEDIHTTELVATVEKPLMVISNGQLIRVTENTNQTRTFHYKQQIPYPNYLVSVVVGEYMDAPQKAGNTIIHNFGYPHEIEAVKATTELLPDMIKFIEAKTGMLYPYKEYSQVVVQDYPFPGLVGQNTSAILSDNYIDDYGVHKDFKFLWDGVAVQALANQWFGNLLMPKSWDDIWLNNAFGQYFADIYTEKNNSKDEYLTYVLPFEKGNVLNDWNSDNIHPIVTDTYSDLAAFTSDNYSKHRGALVLSMLQKELGDEKWWKSIQYFVKANAYKKIGTKDFQRAIETITGKSYQWFFDQWIYKVGFPKLAISKSWDQSKKQLILDIKQVENKPKKTDYPQLHYVQGKIEIEIDDKIHSVHLKPQESTTIFIYTLKPPSFVNFNYQETFFCELIFTKTYEEHVATVKYSKDVLAKQNSIDRLVDKALDSLTSPGHKLEIINLLKKEITSNNYWRYRQYTLASLRKLVKIPYDRDLILLLTNLIKNESSWLKASAIQSLGITNDTAFADLYIDALKDESDRVINTAAVALGKSKSTKAYDILLNLEYKPSWKNQNRISALNGLEQLGDPRAVDYVLACLRDNTSPRWYLATPVWDYPYAAANTLVSLGKGPLGFPILFERLKKSLQENDLNDIFQNVQLIDLLKDNRGIEMYDLLKEKFKKDASTLEIINKHEKQFLLTIHAKP